MFWKLAIIISISFFHIVLNTSASNKAACSESQCSSAISAAGIRFPFRLNESQPESCGYPGFDLYCDSAEKTLIQFPHGGFIFAVERIDYGNQEILFSDPENCLPSKLLKFDPSGSPFDHENDGENFWVYNCTGSSSNYSAYYYYNYLTIDVCLSGLNYTVVGTTWNNSSVLKSCHLINNLKIPGRISYGYPTSIIIAWENPDCKKCEQNGNQCQRKGNQSLQIQCSTNSKGSNIKMAAIATGVAAVTLLLCCVACHNLRSRRVGPDNSNRPRSFEHELDPLEDADRNSQVRECVSLGPSAGHIIQQSIGSGSGPLQYQTSPRWPYRDSMGSTSMKQCSNMLGLNRPTIDTYPSSRAIYQYSERERGVTELDPLEDADRNSQVRESVSLAPSAGHIIQQSGSGSGRLQYQPSPRWPYHDSMGSTSTSQCSNVLGLNRPTIDTYPIGPIGLRGYKEHQHCTICLEEYSDPDVLVRRLPECAHPFHVHCIDKWLETKGVCPICKTPTPTS